MKLLIFIINLIILLQLVFIDAKSVISLNQKSVKSKLKSKSPLVSSKLIDLTENNSDVIIASTVTLSNPNDVKAGISSIVGGLLAHLVLGTLYCWGNFLSYSPQNLKFFDGKSKAGVPDALYVIPMTILFQAISIPFGPSLVQKIGTRKTLFLGTYVVALATYFSSFQKSLSSFMLFYSALFGLGVGICYTSPMIAGWSYLPNAKGLVSGAILSGFGLGGFFFSLLGSSLVNPNSLNPTNGVFPQEVYDNFPKMLRTLAITYAVVSTIGTLLVHEPKKPITSTTNKSNTPTNAVPGASVGEALRSPQFWLMWLMVVASATAGLNTASVYKSFAATSSALTGDQYQALVGGLGAIFNGSGRLFWGGLLDMIGFKKAFSLLTVIQAISMLTYSKSSSSKVFFLGINGLFVL